jgi:hypothetical protein
MPAALAGPQADADLNAGAHKAGASVVRLANRLDHLPPVRGAGQPSSSSDQKASHIYQSTTPENGINNQTITVQLV